MLLHPGDPHVAEQNSNEAHKRETVEQYWDQSPHDTFMANGPAQAGRPNPEGCIAAQRSGASKYTLQG